MKKIFSFFAAILFAGSMMATDATLAAGTNGTAAKVNDNDAIKVGTSKKGGDMTITVGAGATSLTFYAAAWNNESELSLNITAPEGVTITPASVALTADAGISNTSPFTLSGTESDFKFDFTLSGVEAESTIKLEGSSAKRFVVWGATYEIGDEPAPALEPATYYSAEGFLTEGAVIDPVQWTACEYAITRNADKTLTFVAEFTDAVTGLVGQINLGDGFKDMTADGLKFTYSTTDTYEDGAALEGAFFYFPYAGAAKRIDITYTVGAENEKPATPKDNRMKGTYNIGGDAADFASLYDACVAIEEYGVIGDVELLICANLTETNNSGLINASDYSITIRPDKDEDRLISFTKGVDNAGPSGAFVIGCDKAITFVTKTAKNITIDGYAEGGETRRLTFDTPQGFGSGAGPILFYGDVQNSKIINCIVNNSRNAGTTGVTVRSAKDTNLAPQGVIIENNVIAPRVNGQAIVFNGSQATDKTIGMPKNTIIRKNIISAANRGVFFNGVDGLVFEDNELTMNGAAGFNAHGLFGYMYVKGNIEVRRNIFKVNTLQKAAGDYGMIAIGSSGMLAESEVKWIIENNYFYGLDALAEPTGNFKLMYVRAGNMTIVRHNTFYVPTFTNAVPMDLVAAQCAAALYLAGAEPHEVQNNIFVCEETASNVSLIRGALNENVKNNVFFHKGGNAAILAGAVVAKTWEEFTAEGANAGSAWAEPTFVDAANGDLAIAESNADLKVARLETVLTDIEGNDRAELTYAGAFEYVEPDGPTAVENVNFDAEGVQKIFRNGEILIIRDGVCYTVTGMIVR